jgi:hypothetical protein
MVHNPKREFFHKLDTPLSSVLCNCLQVSCMIPNRDLYCTYNSTAMTAQWMEQLVASAPPNHTFTLRDLVLPGTHDSGSGTIGRFKIFSAAGRTQNLSLYEQLKAGIRYLDVRVANGSTGGDDILSIWHGCLEGGNLDKSLQGVLDFLQEHTKELVVIELVPEYGKKFSTNQKRCCLDIAQRLLGGSERIIPASQLREIIETKPFGQVISSMSQRVIVLLHNRFFEGDDAIDISMEDISSKYGFGKGDELLNNPWNNTRDCAELMQRNLSTVQQFAPYRDRLLSNQFVATPGVSGGAKDVVGVLTGANSLRPVSHACRLYAPNSLDRFLCQNADESWNIIALDFVDLCPEITDYLISLNWRHVVNTKILFAATYLDGISVDVTDKIQALLKRSAVVYLPDPDQDLQAGSETFTLTVAYSLNGKENKQQFHVVTIDVSGDAPVILSPFCCNEGSIRVPITVDNGGTGFVCRGKVYTTKAEVPKESNATVLEYHIEESHCQFNVV